MIGKSASTPMMLAGFVAAAFFLIARAIVQKNIFPKLTGNLSASLLRLIVERFFNLAVLCVVLGFSGFFLGKVIPEPKGHKFAAPTTNMIKVYFEGGWSIDLLPQPEMKNVNIRLKVIPQADGFTPISDQATLVIWVPSTGIEERYPIRVDSTPEGIPPVLKSYLAASTLLPRTDFQRLITATPPALAVMELTYDPDVSRNGIKFFSDRFEFSDRTIDEQSK